MRTNRFLLCIPLSGLPVLAALSLGACGGEPPPQPTHPVPEATPTEAPAPEPSAAPTAAPSAAPTAAPATNEPPAERSTPVVMENEKELSGAFTTSPGAKLKLGTFDKGYATLRIYEGSLSSAHIVSYKLEPKGKTTGVPLGPAYRTMVQIEGTPDLPMLSSVGRPFELSLPTGNKKDANLAIGEIDPSGKVIWTIIAPSKVDEATGLSYFELPGLGNAYLHLTAKAPTAPAK